jgi:regulator of protease activity HflC (stomatin/prohibitin superfamily)
MKSKWFLFWIVLFNTILIALDIYFIEKKISIDNENVWNWGWVIMSVQVVYTTFSFRIVGPEDLAAILLFGNPKCEVKSGLQVVPWIICALRKESRLAIQIQIPGEPEEIDKSGLDKEGLMEGKKVLPIRVTTGSYETAKANPLFADDPALTESDPLNLRMTVEVTAVIRFKILSIIRFIQNIGSMKEAKKQLRDAAEAVLKGELAKRTPALIIAHWAEINNEIRRVLDALIKDDLESKDRDEWWGIVIETAQMTDLDNNRQVNLALRAVVAAKINANATVAAAKAEGESLALKGKGNADAKLSMLTAEAAGKTKLAEVAKTPHGQFAMMLETAAKTVTESDYSIVGTDGIAGAIAAAMETMTKIDSRRKAAGITTPAPTTTPVAPTTPGTGGI